MNEMYFENSEMFWSADDDRMKWLFNFNAYTPWKKRQDGLFLLHEYCYMPTGPFDSVL